MKQESAPAIIDCTAETQPHSWPSCGIVRFGGPRDGTTVHKVRGFKRPPLEFCRSDQDTVERMRLAWRQLRGGGARLMYRCVSFQRYDAPR